MKLAYALLIVLASAALQNAESTFAYQILSASPDKPTVLEAVAPSYPEIIAKVDIKEIVYIKVQVDKMGVVISSRALTGHPLLQTVAERVAKRWRFAPTEINSSTRELMLTFVFQIMPNGTPDEELTPVFTPPYQIEVRHLPFKSMVNSGSPSSRKRRN
jgi:hypothetical protein